MNVLQLSWSKKITWMPIAMKKENCINYRRDKEEKLPKVLKVLQRNKCYRLQPKMHGLSVLDCIFSAACWQKAGGGSSERLPEEPQPRPAAEPRNSEIEAVERKQEPSRVMVLSGGGPSTQTQPRNPAEWWHWAEEEHWSSLAAHDTILAQEPSPVARAQPSPATRSHPEITGSSD